MDKWILRTFLLLLILTGTTLPLFSEIPDSITVAVIPDLYPLSFLDDEGQPDGIFPQVISEIARQNNFQLEWSIDSWARNLEKTRTGEIDLMIGLIYTGERDSFLDFGNEPVVATWSQLFQAKEGVVDSILDVDGKRIGMMIGDQNAAAFVTLADSFNINYRSIFYDDFQAIYDDLIDGSIDAGVFFSLYHMSHPDLVPTSIIYQPNESLFAIPQGSDDEILRIINKTLAEWKTDENSFYYREIARLFKNSPSSSFPDWLIYLLLGLVALIISALLWLWLLRRQVRQRTAALLNAQEVYRSTFIEADVGILHIDSEGRLIRVNPSFCNFIGYDEQSLLEKNISEIVNPEDRQVSRELIQDLIEGKRASCKLDERYIARDGSILWGHLSISGIRDSSGDISYIVAIIEDITARKSAVSMVEDLQKRYRGVFENSYQMTALFDNFGRLVDVNETLKRVFGLKLSKEELIGLTPTDIDLLGPIGSLRIQEMVEDCLSTGQTIRHMISIEETGIGKAMDVTVKPILDNDRQIQYCVTEAHDVTDLMTLTSNLEQQVEERTREIRDAQQRLIEAEKMASLGRLVAGIAHEINTPVGVAKTGVSFLKEQVEETRKKFSEESLSKDDFSSALESFNDLSTILEQNLDRAIKLIRDFKMTSADQSSHEIRVVPVREYLEVVMHSLSPQLKKTSIKWTVNAQDEEMPLHVGAVNQILANLTINSLSHAFDENESGNILIVYRRESGRRIFEFQDNGRGIPQDIQNRIFEPFFTTGRGKGFTGLGLSIIYNLVNDVLHGRIECISQEGEGTTFIINYPEIKD